MVKINGKKLLAKYKSYKAGEGERRKSKVAKLEYQIQIAKLRAEKRKYTPKTNILGGSLGSSIGSFAKEVRGGYGTRQTVRRKTKKKRKKRKS